MSSKHVKRVDLIFEKIECKNVLKKIVDIVKSWRWGWVRKLIKIIYKEIIIPTVKQLSRDMILFILESIKAQALDPGADGYDKIRKINGAFRERFTASNISNNALNSFIVNSYSALKQRGELYL